MSVTAKQLTLKRLIFLLLVMVGSACVSIDKAATRLQPSPISEVRRVSTIEDIEPLIAEADRNTLVLLDVDDTLIMPTTEFSFVDPARKKWVLESKTRLSKERRDFLISEIWIHRKVKLIENETAHMLQMLEKKETPTFALTAMYTGKFGAIPQVEDWRINELLNAGINFSKLSRDSHQLNFPELKTERGVPMLKDGIIFTAMRDKAEVFFAVLKKLDLKTKTIIFIDDDPNYVHSMQTLCRDLRINFYGFIYTAAKSIPVMPLNEKIEQKRFKYLEERGKWIIDDSLLK